MPKHFWLLLFFPFFLGGQTTDPVVRVSEPATLYNKFISGAQNTITNLPTTALSTPYAVVNGVACYLGLTCNIGGGGLGTVTMVLNPTLVSLPWLTVSTANGSTTPQSTFAPATGQPANEFLATPNGTTGAVGLRTFALGDLPAIAPNSLLMNASGASGVPSPVNMPTCTTGADLYNTSTQQWYCVTTGGAGANTALSNLSGVAINTSLLFASGQSLGGTTGAPQYLFFYGTGTGSFEITGAPTGNQVIAFPNASDTVVELTQTQSLTNKTVDGVTPATFGYVDPTSSIQIQLNSKQPTLSLSTTGTGAATLSGSNLNIPTPTPGVMGPGTSTNGDVVCFFGTGGNVLSDCGVSGSTVVTLAGTQSLTNKTVNGVAPAEFAYLDATSSIQNQLNSKQGTLTLTTTGTSGASTLIGNTLNIPQYATSGGLPSIAAFNVIANNTNASAVPGATTAVGMFGILGDDQTNAIGLGAPASLRKTIYTDHVANLTIGAGQTTGVRTANCTALQNVFNDAAANGWAVQIVPGVYEIYCAAGLTITNTSDTSALWIRGSQQSRIIQFYANAPGVTIGDTAASASDYTINLNLDGLRVEYGVSQTGNTSANLMQIGAVRSSSINHIWLGADGGSYTAPNTPYLYPAYRGFYMVAGATPEFSNSYDNFYIQGAQYRLVDMSSRGTGSVFRNWYTTNGFIGQPGLVSDSAWYISGGDGGVWDQINIEGVMANTIVNGQTLRGGIFNSLHFETIQMIGANPTIWVGGTDRITFTDFDVTGLYLTGSTLNTQTASGTGTVFSTYGDDAITTMGLTVQLQNSGNIVALPLQVFTTSNVGNSVPTIESINSSFDDFVSGGLLSHLNLDANTPLANFAGMTRISHYRWGPTISHVDTAVRPVSAAYTLYGQDTDPTVEVPAGITSFTLTLADVNGASGNASTSIPKVGNIAHVRRLSGTASGTLTIADATAGTLATNTTAAADLYFKFDGLRWRTISDSVSFATGSGTIPTGVLGQPLAYNSTTTVQGVSYQTVNLAANNVLCDGSTDETSLVQSLYNTVTTNNGSNSNFGNIIWPTNCAGVVISSPIILAGGLNNQITGGPVKWKGHSQTSTATTTTGTGSSVTFASGSGYAAGDWVWIDQAGCYGSCGLSTTLVSTSGSNLGPWLLATPATYALTGTTHRSVTNPVFIISSDRNIKVSGFNVQPYANDYTDYPLGNVFQLQQDNYSGSSSQNNQENLFENNFMDGLNAGTPKGLQTCFAVVTGSAQSNSDNSGHEFRNNVCNNFGFAAVLTDNSQQTDLQVTKNSFAANRITGTQCFYNNAGVGITAINNFCGGTTVASWTTSSNTAHPVVVIDEADEGDNEFMAITFQNSATPIFVFNERFSSDQLNSSGIWIDNETPGPLNIYGGSFGQGVGPGAKPCGRFQWGNGGSNNILTGSIVGVTNSAFGCQATPMLDITASGAVNQIVQNGNTYTDSSGNAVIAYLPDIGANSGAVQWGFAYSGTGATAVPTCNSANINLEVIVSDASAHAATYSTGGSIRTKALCNGSTWYAY